MSNDEIYATPKTRVNMEDDKVIELLCRFKYRLKVINMLRQDGMDYEEAKGLVDRNAAAATAEIRKKNLVWNVLGYLFILPIVWMLTMMIWHGYLGIRAIFLIAVLGAISVSFFRLRDKLRF